VFGMGVRRSQRWGREVVGHGVVADERAVGEGARTNERPRCCVGRRAPGG